MEENAEWPGGHLYAKERIEIAARYSGEVCGRESVIMRKIS